MIDCDCSWGFLIGGNEFLVLYLKKIFENQETYYHLVLSDLHLAYPPAAPRGAPSLIQVLIALLLKKPSAIVYKPPTTEIVIRYPTRTRSREEHPIQRPPKTQEKRNAGKPAAKSRAAKSRASR
ncbi:hypothetical protein I7I50_05795 [Histoplasma capsulatum G186AR]|nr:hypothetical protein I7I52_04054 [Histoplasma capsulatum]QSS76372.1 hypothetical protein I7I50_05795 [Histoplasma capsulatum G186AR]